MTKKVCYDSDKIKEYGVGVPFSYVIAPVEEGKTLVAIATIGEDLSNASRVGVVLKSPQLIGDVIEQSLSHLEIEKGNLKDPIVYSVPTEKLKDCEMSPSQAVALLHKQDKNVVKDLSAG